MLLKDKHIILGITGSIAAYKAATLTRLLIKEGAQVKIIVTPLAKEFITPVTLATLSKNTVLCDFFHHDDGAWNSHIELGLWADLMLVAPASANTLAKMAHGIADNLLLTTYLSVRCPVMAAPAMDTDMFQHTATQHNIELLKQRGVSFIEPPSGELASGLIGKGRMEEPEQILEQVVRFFKQTTSFAGKNILITAGPTHEYIDPVRYIGNASSGKMGYAIAAAFANSGANVTLISGPVTEKINHPNVTVVHVVSAQEMLQQCNVFFKKSDIIILAAAVADYTPIQKENRKIKEKNKNISFELQPTPDIAEHLGKLKTKKQTLIGFALETHDFLNNAEAKLKKKNLDAIILNTITQQHNPMGNDNNSITIINKQNKKTDFSFKSKKELAWDILTYIENMHE
ncbi:MAG TPA: bifunctional phosphopantothenoylcysteine decarboxylase/phosphopantothenate--cysteine ligase CoaBC [Bacteroidales bacterium]|nr:bifunctional phosphopantothenoylcysteine decarboxylase/phosphopantothenate--cysteine ligase CoaBC [Bacteroidales bacterium]